MNTDNLSTPADPQQEIAALKKALEEKSEAIKQLNSGKEYQVTIAKCEQTSPDDWEMTHYSLKATDTTTIGQIQDWISTLYGPASNEMKMDFRVVELQSIPSTQ